MAYTEMDRLMDTLNGEPRDRVPILPMVSGWSATNFSDLPVSRLAFEPKLVVEAKIRAREAMGYDAFFAYAEPSPIYDAFGCKVHFRDKGPIMDSLDIRVTSEEDLEKVPVPDPEKDGRLPLVLEIARGLSRYSRGEIPVLGALPGPFTTAGNIFGIEQTLRMTHRTPLLLDSILGRINGFLKEYGKALIKNGVHVMFIPEPSASATMISPLMFRRFVLPSLKELIRTLGIPCMLHICGDTFPLLEAMEESGARIVSLDQCMDLAMAKQRLGEGTVLGGNVDPVNSLLLGDEESVRTDTTRCLRVGGRTRFILMTGCSVPSMTRRENLQTMIDTVKQYYETKR
ncbi:MAG: uroporphyrinogen decarboxylase family protein [Deltaproteobacteria bacterium]|nr:uroporphyrinogen decarboxylase family protein [Deltaproteobacteria bacterium]